MWFIHKKLVFDVWMIILGGRKEEFLFAFLFLSLPLHFSYSPFTLEKTQLLQLTKYQKPFGFNCTSDACYCDYFFFGCCFNSKLKQISRTSDAHIQNYVHFHESSSRSRAEYSKHWKHISFRFFLHFSLCFILFSSSTSSA